jgi:hypothetical protein
VNATLYEINARVWLTALSRRLGRAITLDDVPDEDLDRLAAHGFHWVWLLSVWQTGRAGQRISREHPGWRSDFLASLPDLRDDDVGGSGFAITNYTVSAALGGDTALARLRGRLRARGMRLMLDFVPNHTALDHRWADEHPDFYVWGTASDLARAPADYTRVACPRGDRILAHGRDPFFPAWADTLQLDYANPATQEAMLGELLGIAAKCDGVRCDMAMLLLPEVIERTWSRRASPFWPKAIERVRARVPDFRFLAEVYWNLERALLAQGFDYVYDKGLYDRLRDGDARGVREHLRADVGEQRKLARFLENHDEPRAAATFPPAMHEAAAIVTFLSPGLRLFHEGQLEGRRKRVSPHLVRAADEPIDEGLRRFYDALLALLGEPVFREGDPAPCECTPAWEGNPTSDAFIAWMLEDRDGARRLVTVNYAPHRSQCYVRFPGAPFDGVVRLHDLTSAARYERAGHELNERGLYLDLPPWGHHVFEVAG